MIERFEMSICTLYQTLSLRCPKRRNASAYNAARWEVIVLGGAFIFWIELFLWITRWTKIVTVYIQKMLLKISNSNEKSSLKIKFCCRVPYWRLMYVGTYIQLHVVCVWGEVINADVYIWGALQNLGII